MITVAAAYREYMCCVSIFCFENIEQTNKYIYIYINRTILDTSGLESLGVA